MPAAFKDLYPWLTALAEQLSNQFRAGRLPHALLLSGPAGSGKRQLAEYLTGYLTCMSPIGSEACGRCKACKLIAAGSHPDVLFLEPEGPSKAIKVDAVRRAAHFVGQTAQLDGYRCLLIDPADQLNDNAANALLKILEEPGKKTVFLLVSSQPSQIAPTVRSRCNTIAVGLPGTDQAKAWLMSRIPENDDLFDTLLAISGGSPIKALQAQEAGALEERRTVLATLIKLMERKTSVFDAARALEPVDLRLLIEWWHLLLLDALKVQITEGKAGVLIKADEALIAKITEQLSTNALYLTIDALMEAKQTLLSGYNPNKILVLEELLIGWSHASQAINPLR